MRYIGKLLFGVILLALIATPISAGQPKVDVCHITGEHDFGYGPVPIGHVINVAKPAVTAHRNHGDPDPFVTQMLDGEEICLSANDADNDGTIDAFDCDANDATVNPDAEETPYNGVDDDCNPATPDDDLDGDGFMIAVDCDDTNAAVNPDAEEITYNNFDDDCNPATLDDDLDGDGFLIAVDCDDTDAAVNPGANEIEGNGIDDDCNPDTLDEPPAPQSGNVALGKPSSASSYAEPETTWFDSTRAFDGFYNTRWASLPADPQWIAVDLGSMHYIEQMILWWEYASAKVFEIRLSDDGSNWTTVFTDTQGNNGVDIIMIDNYAAICSNLLH